MFRRSARPLCWLAVLIVGALVGSSGCGRLSFDPIASSDAGGCTGDLLVDRAEDDPGQALACQGAGCSLRAAIGVANARTATTICIADGLAIAVATRLVVTSDVTITGERTTICGTGADRVFHVAAGGSLRLRALTVCHGRLTDDAGAGVRVENGGTLDADQVVFDDHVVSSDAILLEGGAVRADGDAVIELRRSRFTNNRADQVSTATGFGRGGAFAIRATSEARVLIQDTAFEDNIATNVGGALFLVIDGSDLTIERSLFLRNRASEGAAIDINCAVTTTIEITSSTFADNVGNTAARGVIYVCSAATVRVSFSSFSGNQAAALRLETTSSRAELRGNAVHAGTFDLCVGAGVGTSLDHNVADHVDAVCALNGPNDRVADPLLAPLADNGGETATLALNPGSPAIDAAGASCPPTDQRGVARPVGAACDAGAFEAE